ncbi:MAG: hypothetical protein IPG12_14260 [Saprospiraceae bacterium]|nr:hypothetical protein [Saprospiraceae bacterium]
MSNKKINGFFAYVLLSVVFLCGCDTSIDNRKGIIINKTESWIGADWKYWASPIVGEPGTIYFIDDAYKYKKNDTVWLGKKNYR